MNNRGVALVLSYMVIVALATFGAIFGYRSIADSNIVKRYTNSARAFWIAESGLAQTFYTLMPSEPGDEKEGKIPEGEVDLAGGTYQISYGKDTSFGREIKSTGTYPKGPDGIQRVAKGYLRLIPPGFQNTLTAGKNLQVMGALVGVKARGRTRISELYSKLSPLASVTFENFREEIGTEDTVIQIPDKNNNGIPDEFADFVIQGYETLAGLPSDEVVYLPSEGTVNIFPNPGLANKKVIFVKGSQPGKGNVNIYYDCTQQPDENITVISTGTITFFQPLQFQESSNLNTVAWLDCVETATRRARRRGTIFTHRNAHFEDLLGPLYFGTVNVIANDNIYLTEVITNGVFDFSDRGLGGGDTHSWFYLCTERHYLLGTKLINWQEE